MFARVGMALNDGNYLSTTTAEPSVLALLGGRFMAAQFAFYLSDLLTKSMTVLFLLFLVKLLLRHTGVAVAVTSVLMTTAFAGTGTGDPVIRAVVMGSGTALLVTGLARFGLLTIAVGALGTSILIGFPVTYRISAWYSTASYAALAAVTALAVFGFFASTAGARPKLGRPGAAIQ
jgi:hypothetical protein